MSSRCGLSSRVCGSQDSHQAFADGGLLSNKSHPGNPRSINQLAGPCCRPGLLSLLLRTYIHTYHTSSFDTRSTPHCRTCCQRILCASSAPLAPRPRRRFRSHQKLPSSLCLVASCLTVALAAAVWPARKQSATRWGGAPERVAHASHIRPNLILTITSLQHDAA